jgi:hypothetical protein
LIRRDGSPKPAYEELHRLVRGDWWMAETETRTDEYGRFILDAYRGRYVVRGAGASAELTLGPKDLSVTLAP